MAEIASALVKGAAIIGGAIVAIFGILGICAMIMAHEDNKAYREYAQKREEEFLKSARKTEANIDRIRDEMRGR